MYEFINEATRSRYVLILLLALLSDFVAAMHMIALSREWIVIAALTGFTIPFFHFLAATWFVRATTNKERLVITLYESLGVSVGTVISMLLTQS